MINVRISLFSLILQLHSNLSNVVFKIIEKANDRDFIKLDRKVLFSDESMNKLIELGNGLINVREIIRMLF